MDILQSVKSKQHYFSSHSGEFWLECLEKDLEMREKKGYDRKGSL